MSYILVCDCCGRALPEGEGLLVAQMDDTVPVLHYCDRDCLVSLAGPEVMAGVDFTEVPEELKTTVPRLRKVQRDAGGRIDITPEGQ